MSSPAELYAAILADPDSAELRLRYADAVAGTDPDHAELIRLGLEKERLGRQASPLPLEQSERYRRLIRAIGPRIAADVAPLVDEWRLRRGFVELVEMDAESFLTKGDEVYRRAPVRHVILTDAAGLTEALAASPLLGRLTSLVFTDSPIGDEGVEALVRSPHLRKLRYLSLDHTDVGLRGAEALAAADTLPELRYLDFSGNPIVITPQADGQDAVSGEIVDIKYPGYGRRLLEKYGHRPWLTYTSPDPERQKLWQPDFGEV